MKTLPILYSLQNCPYAMRARLAILLAQQTIHLRPIVMKNKPAEMLAVSPKATVPVLVIEPLADGKQSAKQHSREAQIIDESLDIMLWALQRNDPEDLLCASNPDALAEMLNVIEQNDKQFKPDLERYKDAKRYHHGDLEACRLKCEPFVQALERRLSQHAFLMGEKASLLDYALLPFVRQFSKVNRQLYLQGPYTHLQAWLNAHLQSRLFSKAMFKFPLWLDTQEDILFGD
ncbi:glutathione S-transferase [Agarivorans sp. Toyoura001]|uniref:glutathione S-transferase n=1 Tax=Agarivorans sp. Toyoura001 TaxID=2283141 RepID=UPI0010EDE898|nr:glutathione S-transferase [Agarivorans sp. Toyoura001]GDY28010.1 glutathione S-transferase [Agarivorans sp. Toyoura001]